MKPLQVSVIGGGAAGFFAAISCKEHHPGARVTIYEKTGRLLAKVKVSGGGRCNVTHACFSNAQLVKFYPRGGTMLKKIFSQFSVKDTVGWFERRGVRLKTEEDNRIFPVTDDSQTVIDCLVHEARRMGINILTEAPVFSIGRTDPQFEITLPHQTVLSDSVIIATGGCPRSADFKWLEDLGHAIAPPVPSLFTFNMPDDPVRELMGVSVENVSVKIQGARLESSGPLLITHWGMSGPAILKLSSWAARTLNEMNYNFTARVNWLGNANEDKSRGILQNERSSSGKISGKNPFSLPHRLWLHLLTKMNIPHEKTWNGLSKKDLNRLMNTLTNDEYKVAGKTTFREEFVTCGGVSLDDVSPETMQSKKCPGLYFAGEVLDIDGLTGGFNFQAAWSTGYIAGKLSV